jgi:hypothetical protein
MTTTIIQEVDRLADKLTNATVKSKTVRDAIFRLAALDRSAFVGPAGSGGAGGKISQLYDQEEVLLIEGDSGVIKLMQTDARIDCAESLSIAVPSDASIAVVGNISIATTTGDVSIDAKDDCSINTDGEIVFTPTGDYTVSSNGSISIAADADFSVDSGNTLTISSANGIYLSGMKFGTSQSAISALAGELWLDTATNTLKIGV